MIRLPNSLVGNLLVLQEKAYGSIHRPRKEYGLLEEQIQNNPISERVDNRF